MHKGENAAWCRRIYERGLELGILSWDQRCICNESDGMQWQLKEILKSRTELPAGENCHSTDINMWFCVKIYADRIIYVKWKQQHKWYCIRPHYNLWVEQTECLPYRILLLRHEIEIKFW